MLIIRHPKSRELERKYIFSVVFGTYLGLDFRSQPEDRRDVEITLKSDARHSALRIEDVFFNEFDSCWLQQRETSLFVATEQWEGIPSIDIESIKWPLPVLFGRRLQNGTFLQADSTGLQLGLDVFGSAFFLLTRYEELVVSQRDKHNRFAATSSVAMEKGFLNRPLVDEYVEVLWACMKQLWPSLERKEHQYCFYLSCDVDHPSSNIHGRLSTAMRKAGGDILRGRGLRMAAERFRTAMRNAQGDYSTDPYNTFDYMMDIAERHNVQGAFYFITGHSGGAIDGDYTLDMPWMRALMRKIHNRGHEIGLHPSFNTYLDKHQLQREFAALLAACEEEGIRQDRWGGRQHYLRWQAPDTWRHWNDVGLSYDSTVGFADHVGFRCGTCREFPVFNLQTREMLDLIERPLIVMEGTLLAPQYMGLEDERALEWIERLSTTCKQYHGNFTLLWHNSMLATPELRRLFEEAVAIAV